MPKLKDSPLCPICDKPVGHFEYVELSAVMVRGQAMIPLGVEQYHAECYLEGEAQVDDSQKTTEKEDQQKERQEQASGDQGEQKEIKEKAESTEWQERPTQP